MKITNSTYYDTEDLEALVTRVFDAARGLDTKEQHHDPMYPITEVHIRYYKSDTAGLSNPVTVKHIRKHDPYGSLVRSDSLHIGIAERNKLFPSELERLSQVLEGATLPTKVVGAIAINILTACLNGSGQTALRTAYLGEVVEPSQWSFPHKSASRFVVQEIVPSCPVRIHGKASAEKKNEAQIASALQTIERTKASLASATRERESLEEELRIARIKEEKVANKLASAQDRYQRYITLANEKE